MIYHLASGKRRPAWPDWRSLHEAPCVQWDAGVPAIVARIASVFWTIYLESVSGFRYDGAAFVMPETPQALSGIFASTNAVEA